MMEHKAFVFAYRNFVAEFAPSLSRALENDDSRTLVEFLTANRDRVTDPYEGEPLGKGLESLAKTTDVQLLADHALTAYYSPSRDIGLGYDWEKAVNVLEATYRGGMQIVLGTAFGSEARTFDPGKLGSYVQSEAQVAVNHDKVAALHASLPEFAGVLEPVLDMLQAAARAGAGIYVTF